MTVEPYYEDEYATIYHGDCLEVLAEINGDVCFTDPPYNSNLDYGEGTDDNRPDYWPWLKRRIDAISCRTLLVKHSSLKLSGFLQRYPESRVLVWHKPFSSGFPLQGVATHWEPIHLLSGKAVEWTKDVFTVSSGNTNVESTTGHPAQFPQELANLVLSVFSQKNDTVVDPFAGSGTVLVAAKNLGRKAIGIEIEERYCDIAAERLSQGVLDLKA